MSQKDKNTLIIAGIALLIVGIIVLGIKPAFTNIQETKALNAQLKATKQTMKTEIEALPTYEEGLKAAKIDYSKTADRVFADLTNDEIHDVVIDKLVKPLGLEITSLNIGGVALQTVTPYSLSVEDQTVICGTTEGNIQMANVTVGVSGTTKEIISFIDLLNKNEGTFLQSVSFSDSKDSFSISVSFYMVLSDTFA